MFFGGRVLFFFFFLLKYNYHCECFIVFVKFLDWIIAIWMRLARLIRKKGNLRFWKEGQLQKLNI